MAIPHPEQAKYLYSNRNGLVCINTPLKRRMCPWMVPTNKLDASDIMDDPRVTMVYSEEYDSREAAKEAQEMAPEEEVAETDDESFKILRMQVVSSEDKGELRQIGAELGAEYAKNLSLKNTKKAILDHIDKIEEAANR